LVKELSLTLHFITAIPKDIKMTIFATISGFTREPPRNGSRQPHCVYPQPQRWSLPHRPSAFQVHSIPDLAAIDRSHPPKQQQQQQQQQQHQQHQHQQQGSNSNSQEDEWKNIQVVKKLKNSFHF
jgi:hypothetical protein